MAHAAVPLGRSMFLHCRGDGKDLRIGLHGFLLWKLRDTSPPWVLSEEPLFPRGADCALQKPPPVSLQVLSNGTGSCGRENGGSSVQSARRSGWALQNFSDVRRGTWRERLELHPPSLLSMGHTGRSGSGGKRPPTAFASSIPLALQEGRAVEDTLIHRVACGDGQPAAFAPFKTRN